MKKVVLLALSVICVSGLAFGQNVGSIDIFADPGLTVCNIVPPPAPFSVYVAQTNVGDGTTAVQFMLESPANFSSLGESSPYLTIGNSSTGVSVSFSACKSGTFLILTVTYFAAGVTPACDWMSVVADPSDPGVQYIDCSDNTIFVPSAGQARVNPDVTCMCSVPVNETTWGGIKALYQN